jgi:ferrous iron transport protein B
MSETTLIKAGATEDTVVLVGNPNVGKSVLFKNLTSRYVTVSNYPGTTVEIVRAGANFNGRRLQVIDTPGLNDLSPTSDDACATRDLLDEYEGCTVVQVADAKNLRRALLLTMQLAEMGCPLVLVLNMLDELDERGGKIDTDALSEILGVPVVSTVATRDYGTADLIAALPSASTPQLATRPAADTQDAYERSRARLDHVNEIVAETYSISQPTGASLRTRFGFWAMHPVKGLAVFGLILLGIFWFVGLFGAGTLVDILEVTAFEQRVTPAAIQVADAILPFPHAHEITAVPHSIDLPTSPFHEVTISSGTRQTIQPTYSLSPEASLSWLQSVLRFLHDLLIGEYGTITMALSYAIAIVLPIVTTFFLVFSVLEDSGYFPRMAIMVNRAFRIMGLNGKAVLPMILGLGCDTMATMTTRILDTRRERVITTLLLALAVPCSAQLGVLLAMMSVLSPVGAMLWVGLIVGVILLVGWLSSRLFKSDTSDFILEIPPLRRPQLSNVLVKTYSRLNWYLREVIPLFVIGTAILFLLDKLQLLRVITRIGEPLVTGWLGLPSPMTNAFLLGFLRRDFGAVYILDAATAPDPLLTPLQIFVSMVTITLFVPCIANVLMIANEHGSKVALRMAAFIFPFAFLVGGTVNQVGKWLLAT